MMQIIFTGKKQPYRAVFSYMHIKISFFKKTLDKSLSLLYHCISDLIHHKTEELHDMAH